MRLAATIVLLLAAARPVAAADDVTAGKAMFERCRICHNIEAGAGNKVGPNLHGVFGRKAGTVEGFAYSEAMTKSGIVWNDNTLRRYLRDPRGFLPDSKMAFPGIKDDKEMADLLAYLHQAAQ